MKSHNYFLSFLLVVALVAGCSEDSTSADKDVDVDGWSDNPIVAPSLTLSSYYIYLANEIGAQDTVAVTTNQDHSTIKAEISDEDNYEIVLSDSLIIVTAKSINNTVAATVTVSVGEESNTLSGFLTVSQLEDVVSVEKPAIGNYLDGGVIFWISTDSLTVKVVHPTEGYPVQWYDEVEATVVVGADSDSDGEYNTAKIKEASDYDTGRYSAVAWCEAFGEGWYMPSRLEMAEVLSYAYDDTFNAALEAYEGASLTQGQYFWTSTEATDANAYTARNKDGEVTYDSNYGKYNSKNGGRYLRAIKRLEL